MVVQALEYQHLERRAQDAPGQAGGKANSEPSSDYMQEPVSNKPTPSPHLLSLTNP